MSIEQKTIEIINSRFKPEIEIKLETEIADFIFDSFGFVELVGALEQEFKIPFIDHIFGVETVQDIVNCILEVQNAKKNIHPK